MSKEIAYTEEMVNEIVGSYEAVAGESYEARSEVVAELAEKLGKTVPSIRGVLVRAGVYIAKEAGAKSVASEKKEDLVTRFTVLADFGHNVTFNENEVKALNKLTRSVIEKLNLIAGEHKAQ